MRGKRVPWQGLAVNHTFTGLTPGSTISAYVIAANAGGEATCDFGGTNDSASGVALQGDGKIIVAGGSLNSALGSSVFAVARFNTDGTLDTSFGTGGTSKITTAAST